MRKLLALGTFVKTFNCKTSKNSFAIGYNRLFQTKIGQIAQMTGQEKIAFKYDHRTNITTFESIESN